MTVTVDPLNKEYDRIFMETCTEKLVIKSSFGCAHGFDRFITRREKKSKHHHRQGFAIPCRQGS